MRMVDLKDIVLFENDDYILVNTPPYVSALDDRDQTAPSLKDWAKEYHAEASLCHRLDKETSGVLAIAKHSDAYRNLAMQFEHRQVVKLYHALCEGMHEYENDLINLPLHKLSNGNVTVDKYKGKDAMTVVNTLKAYKDHTLVECKPITGRLHQIRVHLAYFKAPIVGDVRYGGRHLFLSELKRKFNLKKGTEEQPLMKRVALHAHMLAFKGMNGEEVSAVAPYPKDYNVLIKQLEKFG